MRFLNEMMVNAPRTYAYTMAKDTNLFFKKITDRKVFKIQCKIAFLARKHGLYPVVDKKLRAAYNDCRRRGWGVKEAYKIASGHWNNRNHPGIEPDWDYL